MPKNRERQRANRKLKRQMMASQNTQGYSDRTANAAINSVMREGVKRDAKKS